MRPVFWFWSYLLVALLLALDHATGFGQSAFWLKPLLMPLLIGYVIFAHPGGKSRAWLLGALLFSWLGDILLLPWPGRDLFLYGLGSFLIAQLFYIRLFWTWPKARIFGRVVSQLFWLIPFVVFWMVLMGLMWGGMDGMIRPAVLLYGLVITMMGVSALNCSNLPARPYGDTLLAGALLFMLSDSLIGLGQFGPGWGTLPLHRFWVMSTYMAAQGLLVWSLVHATPRRSGSDRTPVSVSPDRDHQSSTQDYGSDDAAGSEK